MNINTLLILLSMVSLQASIQEEGYTLSVREERSDDLYLRISRNSSKFDSKTQSFVEGNETRQLILKDEYESTQNRGYLKTLCFGLVISGVVAAIFMCLCKLCNEVQKTVREVDFEEGNEECNFNEINRTGTEQHLLQSNRTSATENRPDTQHVQGSVGKDYKTHVHQDFSCPYVPASNPNSGPPPCYHMVNMNNQETLPPSYGDLFKGDS